MIKRIIFSLILIPIIISSYFGITSFFDKSLINKRRSSKLTELEFAGGHIRSPIKPFVKGDSYIGAGMLYYGLVYAKLSKVAVVIGSGGGFAPQVIAQAQKDMGIKNAVTYLIDAHSNVSYGKPFWDKSHIFADNIYNLNMRSSYAAKLFAQENIKIDYLHIDGDHSTKGVLEDWHYYYPLLSNNAIITFHDCSYIPEVTVALNKIKKDFPNIEFISLPNTGAGIVIAQLNGSINSEINDKTSDKTLLSYFNNTQYLMMEDAFFFKDLLAAFNTTDYNKVYDYLQTEKFQERYKIAADYLNDSDSSIIEIGGFPNSILHYINRSTDIKVIEKYGTTDWINNLYLKSLDKKIDLTIYPTLEDIELTNINKYNLIALGFCLQYDVNDREKIYKDVETVFNLIYKANKITLEHANWPKAIEQYEFIKKVFRPNIDKYIKLDLNEPSVTHSEIYIRNLYLINGINPIEGWNSKETINKMVDIIISQTKN